MRIMHKLEVLIIIYNLKMQILVWTGIRRRDYMRGDLVKKKHGIVRSVLFFLSEVMILRLIPIRVQDLQRPKPVMHR